MQSTKDLLNNYDFGSTYRVDRWWSQPIGVFIGLSLFVIYGTARLLYPIFNPSAPGIEYGSLLSPFFSPLLFSVSSESHHALFGLFPTFWPELLRSPAILILWAPLGLRLTCYYYRKAYYRAFLRDPPACAVSEGRRYKYAGETRLFLFQNLHRYFVYLGIIFICVLTFDAIRALFWHAPAGSPFWEGDIELHVGTLILGLNALLLSGYTFGCHSLRYLVGGNSRCFSCVSNPENKGKDPTISKRYTIWKIVSSLNVNHSTWAWFSLFMVAFTAFYVWMVSIGVWPDIILLKL